MPYVVNSLLYQKVETWFQNNRPHGKKEKAISSLTDFQSSTSWNLRRVVQKVMKERIDQLITDDHGATAGSPEYLIQYQSACSRVIEKLTEEEKNHC
jgi:hypothetical protein